MRILFTTIFSLLLLASFAAPVSIDVSGIDLSVALAEEAETTPAAADPVDDDGSRFLGERGLTSLLQSIAALFLQLGASFLWLAGALFNFGIQYSIIEFANFANIEGIAIAWTVLRDIANVFFIFIFLAIGIGTILNIQQYGVKRLLPVLLAIAVLINFSLFFTRATIDIAHGFAGAILNQSGVVQTECTNGNCSITQGVATAFMEQLGVVNIFGASVGTAVATGERFETSDRQPIFTGDSIESGFSAIIFGLFGFIFLVAAAIVFLAGAVMLIMRIVNLLLLMIASAPALAAYILPSTRKHFDRWLESLLKEAFFAPILLLLFSISLLFLNTARGAFVSGDQSFAQIFIEGNLDSVNIIIIFLIALGLLFTSIKVASDMGVAGAKQAMGIQNFARNQTQGVIGRNTVGRASQGLDRLNRYVRREAKEAKGGTGAAARVALGAASALTLGGLSDRSINKVAQAGRSQKFGSDYSVDSSAKEKAERSDALDAETDKLKKEAALAAAEKSGNDAEIQEALNNMSDKQILELKATRIASEEIARNLTPAQLKKVLENDKISEDAKEKVREVRFKKLDDAIKGGSSDAIKDTIRSYDDDELDFAPREMLMNPDVASTMKGSQASYVKKSKNFTAAQKTEFKTARTKKLVDIIGTAAGAPGPIKNLIKNLDVDEIIDLTPDQLSDPNVAINLSIPVLTKLQNEREVPNDARERIARALQRRIASGEKGIEKYLNGPAGNFWKL